MREPGGENRSGAPNQAGTSRVAATAVLWALVGGLAGLVWLQAQHPFTGLPLTHPVNLLLFALDVGMGLFFTVGIWLSSDDQPKGTDGFDSRSTPQPGGDTAADPRYDTR